MLSSGRATGNGGSRGLVVALYFAASVAVFALAFWSPRAAERTCAPSPDQADIELCIETQRFVSPPVWDAVLALALVATMALAGLAWLQWRPASSAVRQVTVVDTPRLRVERFRGRMGLLSVAAFPMFGGFAIGAATSSSYTMGERSCRPGTGVVVEICEQHSVETERIVREASSWSMPLVAAGSLLLLGTILWWIHASRHDQQIAVPEYRYVAPGPQCTRG